MSRISGLRRIFRFSRRSGSQIEHEVDAELRFHLDRHTEELIDQGMTPEAAHREAVRQFGDLAYTKQYCCALGRRTERKVRRTMLLDEFRHDVRYGVRMLAKHRGFTTVAVLSLALGIGATTTIFSVLNAAVLRPLPFREPDRLVEIREFDPERGRQRGSTVSTFHAWRDQNQTFEQMVDGGGGWFATSVSWAGGTERVGKQVVSAHLFHLLGVEPVLGRAFVAEDFRESPVSGSAVVISFGLWQQLFDGDPAALGQELTVGSEEGTKTIVGVMPPGFWVSPQSSTVHVWVADDNTQASLTAAQSAGRIQVVGRLKGGVSVEQAEAELRTISRGRELDAATEDTPWRLQIVPLAERLSVRYAGTLYVLLGAVGCVLLIACLNVATLSLGRAAARGTEIATRLALGAGRRRVLRQLLTESLLLGLLGGVLGVGLAVAGIKLFSALAAGWYPPTDGIRVDGTVLGFTVGALALDGDRLRGGAGAAELGRPSDGLAQIRRPGHSRRGASPHQRRLGGLGKRRWRSSCWSGRVSC